jgi:ABC-type branched-subunit amino acid transport system substrate-binding protein
MNRIRAVVVSLAVGGMLAGALVGAPGPAGAQGKKAAVVVGSIQQSDVPAVNKQNRAGLKAGVLAAKRAGVNVKVKVCDEGADPNSGAQCARDFVQDPEVVGLVGTASNFGAAVDPVLEEANLPSIGQSMFGLEDFASPMIFPADGGSISGAAAAGPICFNNLKEKSISLAYIDNASGAQLIPVMNTFVLKPFNKELTTSVPIPVGAAELSSQAAKIVSDNADCLLVAAGQEQATQLTQALKQQGYKGHIMISGQVHSPSTLVDQLGKDAADGIVLIVGYDYAAKDAKQFVKDMTELNGEKAKSLISDQSLKAWLSVRILADTVKGMDAVDRATLLDALKPTVYPTNGLLQGPLDYTARVPNPDVFGGAAPNLILPYAIGAVMKNGKLKALGTWEDAFGGPA